MKIKKIPQINGSWIIVSLLIIIVRSFKFSYIWGSKASFFSLSKALFPLAGAFGGWLGALTTLLTSFAVSYSFQFTPSFLAYHIPGFFASLYWAFDSYAIRLIAPIACIVLFIAHPVGFYAAPYSLFWLIPIVLYVMDAKHPFLLSIGATFTAHGIGSLISLYMVNSLTSVQWIFLMPLVCIERLTLALIMYSVGMVVGHVPQLLIKRVKKSYQLLRFSKN